MHNILRSSTVAKIKLLILLNTLMSSWFQNELILWVRHIRIFRLHSTVMRNLVLKSNLCLMSSWNIWIASYASGTQTIIQILWTLITNTISETLKFVLNLRNWVLGCVWEIADHACICDIHGLMTNLKALFNMRSSLWFLDITPNCIVLSKTRRLASIGCISTFSKILKLAVVSLTGTNLLDVTLRMINSSIWVMMTGASDLIRTVPLITWCSHSFKVVISDISCILLTSGHAYAINMLWLSFPNNSANRLGHIVWAHRWVLMPNWDIALSEIHLIHIADTAFSHLIFGRHGDCSTLIRSIRRMRHHLHLLVTEATHFIIMHYSY